MCEHQPQIDALEERVRDLERQVQDLLARPVAAGPFALPYTPPVDGPDTVFPMYTMQRAPLMGEPGSIMCSTIGSPT